VGGLIAVIGTLVLALQAMILGQLQGLARTVSAQQDRIGSLSDRVSRMEGRV
jgi:HAMP domain-containing protein